MSESKLDEHTQNRIRWKRRDIANLVEGTHLEAVLGYELFMLEQQFTEAIEQGSKQLAIAALDYAQHIEILINQHSKPKR